VCRCICRQLCGSCYGTQCRTSAALPAFLLQAQKVSSELAEYKAESKAIKNQDLTIRKQVRTNAACSHAKQQGAATLARCTGASLITFKDA
jgi:hypothetical protein